MKYMLCIENDVVVNFNDVIRIVHCALNIDLRQPIAILTRHSLKDSPLKMIKIL